MLDFLSLIVPPAVLHSLQFPLGFSLQMLEVILFGGAGGVILPLSEGTVLLIQQYADLLIILKS